MKLSARGLAAQAMIERGMGPETRGTIMSNAPDTERFITVLVDGAAEETWGKEFWRDDGDGERNDRT